MKLYHILALVALIAIVGCTASGGPDTSGVTTTPTSGAGILVSLDLPGMT